MLAGAFGWNYLRSQRAEAYAPTPPVVSSVTAEQESWTIALSAIGTVVPVQGVLVTAEVDGQVEEIYFTSGQHVETGDAIVQLDDELERSELESLLADRKLAELTLERRRQLVRKNLASQSDLDEVEAALESAMARVAAKRVVIRKKRILAPFAGELGIRRVSPGRYVAAGDEIVSLVAVHHVFVDYTLPERYLSQLAPGQTVEVTVRAHAERVFVGKLRALSPIVREGTRSVQIRALFDNSERLLRPGMYAEVRTIGREPRQVTTLPEYAVTYAPYGSSVFVIENGADGPVAVRRQVETGEVTNGRIEIRRGVMAGERVVGAGHQKLRSGQRIAIDNSVQLGGGPARP